MKASQASAASMQGLNMWACMAFSGGATATTGGIRADDREGCGCKVFGQVFVEIKGASVHCDYAAVMGTRQSTQEFYMRELRAEL
jgi:hypothetical protein